MRPSVDHLVTSDLTLADIEFIDPVLAAQYGQSTANLRRIRYYRQRDWARDRFELAMLIVICLVGGAVLDRFLVAFS